MCLRGAPDWHLQGQRVSPLMSPFLSIQSRPTSLCSFTPLPGLLVCAREIDSEKKTDVGESKRYGLN